MLHIRNLEEGVELFKVLGSDIRVNIILLLLKEKEMNMNEIAARLQITNGALTSHIRKPKLRMRPNARRRPRKPSESWRRPG